MLVMDAGNVVEYDHPYSLLQNKQSFFAKMVAKTGADTEAKCKQIAKEVGIYSKHISIRKWWVLF